VNKEHLLFHLQEALEELSRTVNDCEKDPGYSDTELFVAMQHLYHHLNTAWNTRALPSERIEQASDEDFNSWGSFPTDLPPLKV
jgi:hypothetical protein